MARGVTLAITHVNCTPWGGSHAGCPIAFVTPFLFEVCEFSNKYPQRNRNVTSFSGSFLVVWCFPEPDRGVFRLCDHPSLAESWGCAAEEGCGLVSLIM